MSGIFNRLVTAAKALTQQENVKMPENPTENISVAAEAAIEEQSTESPVPAHAEDAERVPPMSNEKIQEVLQSTAAEALSRIGAVQRYLVANRSGFRSVLGYEAAEKLMNDMHGAVYTLAYYGKKVSRGFYNSLEYVAKENFEHLPAEIQLLRLNCLNTGIEALLDGNENIPVQTRYKNLRAAFAMFHKPEHAAVSEHEKVYA